jgi:hypothetical protein
MPWFIRLESDKGHAHRNGPERLRAGDWPRVTMDTERDERRVFVDGILRHTWRDDFSDVRSRI